MSPAVFQLRERAYIAARDSKSDEITTEELTALGETITSQV